MPSSIAFDPSLDLSHRPLERGQLLARLDLVVLVGLGGVLGCLRGCPGTAPV
jgi:hypothetical protein